MTSITPFSPRPSFAPAPHPQPAPALVSAATPSPGTTPVRKLPSWYGTKLGRQDRSFFSQTGDVNIYAGQTFPTRFKTVNAAMNHAVTRTISQGAVAVMEHDGRYFITRLYNAEYAGKGRYDMRQTDFSRGFGKLKDLHPALRALVDAAGATFTA